MRNATETIQRNPDFNQSGGGIESPNEELQKYNFVVEDISGKISPEIKAILEKEKPSPEEMKKLGLFINDITDGKYFDHRFANHVLDAHYSSGGSKTSKILEDIDTKKFRQASGSDFWLAFGESRWVDKNIKNTELVVFSADNPKFAEFLFARAANYFWDTLPKELKDRLNESYKLGIITKEEIKETLSTISQNTKFNEDLKNLERVDEEGNIYYEVSFNDDISKDLLPILMLEKKLIKIKNNDTTGGIAFNGGPTGLDTLAKQLKVSKLKWIDIADTVVNLKEGRVYRYKAAI